MDASLLIDYPNDNARDANSDRVVRVLLTISGTAPVNTVRTPIGLSLVLDRSGSMAGPPLHAARSAAARAVERLHPDDVVSAVLFDGIVDTLAEPARCRDQHQLAARLKEIETGGNTNLSGGWLRGRHHMEVATRLLTMAPGTSRRVVLLTDGHANEGITDVETLVELARTARKEGITTSTIGVGDGYDDVLLRAMADAGGGNAWYVERPDQAQDVFAEEMGNLLSVAAQGLEVALTLSPEVEVLAVHSSWPAAARADVFIFDMGDLYASEPKPLLLELKLPGYAAAPHSVVATLVVRAHVLTDGGGINTRTITLPIAATMDGQSLVLPEVERAILLARTAKAREEAAQQQRDGNGNAAAQIMRVAASALVESPLSHDPRYATELSDEAQDLGQLEGQYESASFTEADAKYQMQRSYNRKRGKSTYDAQLRRPNSSA